jgi:hypothetical protein
VCSSFFDTLEEIELRVQEFVRQIYAIRNNYVMGIVEDTLTVEVTSYNVPNLTLLYLPGIVATARKGEPAGKRNLLCHVLM